MIRFERPARTEKVFRPSFIQKEVFDGRLTCADPSGIFRGTLYHIWICPLRLAITLGRRQ